MAAQALLTRLGTGRAQPDSQSALPPEVAVLVTTLAVAAAVWAILMALGPLLQIRSMVRQGSSREVSIAYFGILLVGFALWVAYGLADGILVLVIPNSVAFLAALATVVVALRYR